MTKTVTVLDKQTNIRNVLKTSQEAGTVGDISLLVRQLPLTPGTGVICDGVTQILELDG